MSALVTRLTRCRCSPRAGAGVAGAAGASGATPSADADAVAAAPAGVWDDRVKRRLCVRTASAGGGRPRRRGLSRARTHHARGCWTSMRRGSGRRSSARAGIRIRGEMALSRADELRQCGTTCFFLFSFCVCSVLSLHRSFSQIALSLCRFATRMHYGANNLTLSVFFAAFRQKKNEPDTRLFSHSASFSSFRQALNVTSF
jgi:hypothetical protein